MSDDDNIIRLSGCNIPKDAWDKADFLLNDVLQHLIEETEDFLDTGARVEVLRAFMMLGKDMCRAADEPYCLMRARGYAAAAWGIIVNDDGRVSVLDEKTKDEMNRAAGEMLVRRMTEETGDQLLKIDSDVRPLFDDDEE